MKSLVTVLEPLSFWILFSLLAIAFVGSRPYLALAICVAGGITMGLSSVTAFSSLHQEATEKTCHKKEEP